jgi:N-acetyl-gamma-glutamyl-phosphate reductase
MIKVGVVGGTGYTGVELLRLLVQHPEVEIECVTSRSGAGKPVSDLFPNLRNRLDIPFSVPDEKKLAACDVVFFATPNGTAMKMARSLLNAGTRIIDLAADYRLKDPDSWQEWYGMPHETPDLLQEAVYGLPELHREKIASARLIANPGFYPTAVQLGFIPLIEAGIIDTSHLIADAKSGVSGAGRGANIAALMCEASESFKAYGVAGHRHLPEIKQGLADISNTPVGLTFVPHLTPMIRGIHATLYCTLNENVKNLQTLFEARYADETFVDVMPQGQHPETRSVKGTNTCRIAVYQPQGGDTVVVLSVIDNLGKGAASQALQNMNIMFSLPETTGLEQVALMP